jgi:hypothetical protein
VWNEYLAVGVGVKFLPGSSWHGFELHLQVFNRIGSGVDARKGSKEKCQWNVKTYKKTNWE